MKALKYKVKISIDSVHSWGDRMIDEIFIPELEVIINSKGGCFFSTEKRSDMNLEEIEIDEEYAYDCQSHAGSVKEIEYTISQLFDK